jgi:hypothetical protein
MTNKERIVRIVVASEKPHLPEQKSVVLKLEPSADLTHKLVNLLYSSAIFILAFFLVIILFKTGVAPKEIAVMVGFPLSVGILTRYAIF